MDWAGRCVPAWRRPNTIDAASYIEALEETMHRYGRPEIFNTDQCMQFNNLAVIGNLKHAGLTICMDGRGRCMDKIFSERLWRSLKYEAVHPHKLTDGLNAERVIAEWVAFITRGRPIRPRRTDPGRGEHSHSLNSSRTE